MMPFQIVEKPQFLHLMKKAVPQYKVPTWSYFSTNKIPAMYKEVRASVEEQMAEGVCFGATTDLWTSTGGGGEPFMSFTVHYLATDWKLKSLYFPEDHTAEHITEMMENMLLDYKIKKESLSGITTHNASNMRNAFASFPCVWFPSDKFGHFQSPQDTKGGIHYQSMPTFDRWRRQPARNLMAYAILKEPEKSCSLPLNKLFFFFCFNKRRAIFRLDISFLSLYVVVYGTCLYAAPKHSYDWSNRPVFCTILIHKVTFIFM